ncbi:rRNA accumulation- protein [Dispira parvispora]|uniref:rRNA accumulation- protein n=1 Tax=Dispira parvispora TaxID=1520584 RepID=A0A9W8AZ39_9FUNG|nr:rRNA accumulation- protein [Dispira parvispora]
MASHPNRVAFTEGVAILLNSWPILRTAVESGWGGPESEEKQKWFIDTLVDYIGQRGQRIEPEEVEHIMLQILTDEFNVADIEDSSVYHLAAYMVKLYKECVTGNHQCIQRLKEEAQKKSQGTLQLAETHTDSESDSTEFEDTSAEESTSESDDNMDST